MRWQRRHTILTVAVLLGAGGGVWLGVVTGKIHAGLGVEEVPSFTTLTPSGQAVEAPPNGGHVYTPNPGGGVPASPPELAGVGGGGPGPGSTRSSSTTTTTRAGGQGGGPGAGLTTTTRAKLEPTTTTELEPTTTTVPDGTTTTTGQTETTGDETVPDSSVP